MLRYTKCSFWVFNRYSTKTIFEKRRLNENKLTFILFGKLVKTLSFLSCI